MAWKWIGGLDGCPFDFCVLSTNPSDYLEYNSYNISESIISIDGTNLSNNTTTESGYTYTLKNNKYVFFKNYNRDIYCTINENSSRYETFTSGNVTYDVYRYLIGAYDESTKKAFIGSVSKVNYGGGDIRIDLSKVSESSWLYDWLFENIVEPAIKVNSTDYTIYIDGDRLPNYNLNWNPDGLGEYSEHSQVVIEFRAVASNPLLQAVGSFYDKTDYTNGFFKFNWSDVWQKLDAKITIIDDFLTNEFTIFIHSSTNINGENIKPHTSVAVNLLEKKNINGDLYRELVTPSSTGDTLSINFGEGKDTDDYYYTDSGENDEHSSTIGYDIGSCNLTACYELSVERLNNIASKLWSNDFFDNILLINNTPIENILSCKLLPLSLSGIESSIKIGNVDMGINGNRLNSTVIRYNIGNISIPRIANMGFLNYAPYTSITIFLPFIGFKQLNTSDVMGRNISIDYIVDVITGACKCCINVNGYQCYEYDGNCGIDIPLTSSNRSQVEIGYVQSALGVVTNISSSNYIGAIGETISGAVQQYHYNTNGSYSPSTGAYEDRTCFIIIDRPQYSEVSKFAHTKGYKCQLTKTIKNLNGFLKTTDNVDLSNISAPKFCKDKILELLSSGVYV